MGGGSSFSLRVIHISDKALLWILHTLLRGFILPLAYYSMYLMKSFFLENSHFLVSPSTQHAVPVGTQYRLVLCGAPPSPASVVVL